MRPREAPPRGRAPNPEEAAPQPANGSVVASIPIVPLVLTTAVTTITGFVVLELIRGGARWLRESWQRKAEDREAALNPPKPEHKIGTQPDGSFRLPGPGDFGNAEQTQVRYSGFAQAAPPAQPRPAHTRQHLTDVSTHDGYVEHRLNNVEQKIDRMNDQFERYFMAMQRGPGEEVG